MTSNWKNISATNCTPINFLYLGLQMVYMRKIEKNALYKKFPDTPFNTENIFWYVVDGAFCSTELFSHLLQHSRMLWMRTFNISDGISLKIASLFFIATQKMVPKALSIREDMMSPPLPFRRFN